MSIIKANLVVVFAVFAALIGAGYAQDDQELAKKSQNPVADMISLPFQNNTSFGIGEYDRTQNVMNIQPVMPFTVGPVNVITRTIVPLIYQPDVAEKDGGTFGLGDINASVFLSPAKPSKFIYGVGPAIVLPTGTDRKVGTGKLGIGPSFVGLTMSGPWVIGVLTNNVWSVAGKEDRADTNNFLLQYFVNYNMPKGWYITSAPIITANWEADEGNRWIVPFGAGAGRVFQIGRQPINAAAAAFYNAKKPDGGPDWSLRLQLVFLFPK